MNFNQSQFWPGLVVLFGIFFFIVVVMEKRFFSVIKTYWFYHRSLFSYLSTFLFLIGIAGLTISLLDLRGPEEKIKTEMPVNRTIILIDTSASMLAEDVKPSRLQKAALIAKHFARKAIGQQLAIVAFAEIQKKIVPFTNDLDLIDARLDSLKNLRNQYGSSALSLAIQESIQYFREIGGEERGNIVVFTDGEETAEGIDLKIPKDVHVALVGIGTTMGGRIPLDDGRGFRFGYKKDKGRDVITKLNENFFKRVVADIPSAKYWIADTYSLPSEEILAFFKSEDVKGKDQQDMVVKPVLMEWAVVPALILIILSYFFKFLRVFTLGLFLIIAPLHAKEDEVPELPPEVISKLTDLQKGKLSQLEKVKLADELHRGGSKDEALSLYEENLPGKIDSSIPKEAYLNYGTALLEKGEIQKGLEVYDRLSQSLDKSAESQKLQETIDKNVVSSFKQQEQKKKEEKQKKDQEKKEGKDQDQSGKNEQNKDQKNNEGSGKQDKQKQKGSSEDMKDDQKNKDKPEKGEDKDQNNKDKNDEEKKNDDKENEGEKKPLPPKKIPAKLKQLMSDDRQLQMKMIENGTKDLNKRKSRKSKDW